MRKAPIPAGYHDAEGAAKLLGIKKYVLLKMLRELTWVHTGGDLHNLPRREYKANGYMTTLDGSYCLKGKKEIVKKSSKLLLSQTGFQEFKKIVERKKMESTQEKPTAIAQGPAPTTSAHIVKMEHTQEKPFNQAAADAERQKCLAELAEMGIPTVSGWK